MNAASETLTRGVANIIPSRAALEELLLSGKKLNIYLGIDPTATRIHLGHAVPLRKLQHFASAGHNVTFLIGDFTALIGDTSDKDTERPVLTPEQIEANFASYKQQASKILDFSRVTVHHNSEWLGKLNFADIIKLTRHFSLNDFISRELIKKRLTEGKSVSLPETLYPVMQGYDSYFMDTDLQLGGTDQTFNMQAGRTLQKVLRNKESFVLSTVFLEGTDGRKMSKSWGNAIWLDDAPHDMYGKVMSLKDELIMSYFTLGTNTPVSELAAIQTRLNSEENPMQLKKELALKIVTELHSSQDAQSAQTHFEQTIQRGEVPEDIPTITVTASSLEDAILEAGLVPSRSEVRRLIAQKGIEVNGEKSVIHPHSLKEGDIIRVGKKKFAKIHLSS